MDIFGICGRRYVFERIGMRDREPFWIILFVEYHWIEVYILCGNIVMLD